MENHDQENKLIEKMATDDKISMTDIWNFRFEYDPIIGLELQRKLKDIFENQQMSVQYVSTRKSLFDPRYWTDMVHHYFYIRGLKKILNNYSSDSYEIFSSRFSWNPSPELEDIYRSKNKRKLERILWRNARTLFDIFEQMSYQAMNEFIRGIHCEKSDTSKYNSSVTSQPITETGQLPQKLASL